MDTPKQQGTLLERFPPDIWAYFASYISGEQLGRLMMTGATLLRQRLKYSTVVKSIHLGKDYLAFKSFPRFLNDFPSLENLTIESFGDDWSHRLGMKFDLVPSGVRKLELYGDWDTTAPELFGGPDRTLNLSEHIPHLEYLNVKDIEIPSYTWMIHCPRSLTDLRIRHWDGTVELPTTLVHFEATRVKLSTGSFVAKLPPSLETFVTYSFDVGYDLLVPLLPNSLRELCFGYGTVKSAGPSSSQNLLERLPKFLTELTLPDSTEIDFKTYPESTKLLPSTLTELSILPDFPCLAWPLLPQNLRALSILGSGLECAVLSKIFDKHGLEQEVTTIPFDSLPRSITKLELSPISYDKRHHKTHCVPAATSYNHSYFPPQLTHLTITNIHLSPEMAKLLPACLTYLKIENVCERVCEHLPTGLQTLIASGALMSPNLIKFLPKSLTDLQLSVPSAYYSWYDPNTGSRIEYVSALAEYSIHTDCISERFDWKGLSPLPSSLTHFHLRQAEELGDSFLLYQQLPNLLKLNLDSSKHFSDLSIPLLSPCLQKLDLSSSSKVSGKSFPFLPRHLAYLKLYRSESIFDSDIQHLPRTLEELYLKSAMHLTDLCIPDLPPHLISFSSTSNRNITPSSFPLFPYSLRSSQSYESLSFATWSASMGVVQYS